MICPKCKNEKINCYDSRPGVDYVVRRKKCPVCGYRFKTMEITEKQYRDMMSYCGFVNKFTNSLRDLLSVLEKEYDNG